MLDLIRNFLKEEDGMGTVELVIILAVLVGIALIFRKHLFSFVNEAVNTIFNDQDMQNVKQIPK